MRSIIIILTILILSIFSLALYADQFPLPKPVIIYSDDKAYKLEIIPNFSFIRPEKKLHCPRCGKEIGCSKEIKGEIVYEVKDLQEHYRQAHNTELLNDAALDIFLMSQRMTEEEKKKI